MPMFHGQGSTAKLPEVRRRLEEKQAALATTRKILEGIDGELDVVAQRAHLGEINEGQAQEALAEVEERERRHNAEVDHLERTIGLLQDEIVQLASAESAAVYKAAADRAVEGRAAAVAGSANFAKLLKSAFGAAIRMERARESADELAKAAAGLHADGPRAGRIEDQDEAPWLDEAEIAELFEIVAKGPRRPLAEGAARSEAARLGREQQDAEIVRFAAEAMCSNAVAEVKQAELERVPARLRARVDARVRELSAQRVAQREERDRREAAAKPQRVLR